MATLGTVMVIAILVFGVGIGIFEFADDILTGYGVTLEGNLSKTQTNLNAALNDTNVIARDIQSKIDESGAISVAGGFAILTKAALAAIKLPFLLISTASTLVSEVFIYLGLPAWAFTVAIAIVITIIAFAVFSAVLRQRI